MTVRREESDLSNVRREEWLLANGQRRVLWVVVHDDGTVTKKPWYQGWADALRACVKR